MNLEPIVLPFAESQSLVEHGIVLDTALCWYIPKSNGIHQICVWVKTSDSQDDEIPIATTMVPAPVFSELLDAIDPAESSAEKMIVLAHALIALHEEVKS